MGFFDRLFGRANGTPGVRPGAHSPSRPQPQHENLYKTFEQDQDELAEEEAYRILKQNETLDEAEEWATFGEWAPMASSNVAGASYEHEEERLTIGYLDGSYYQYQPVSYEKALDFYRAGSKGTWVWDNLRVRGTVFGYQVPYTFLSGPSTAKRGWMKTTWSRRKHGEIGPSGKNSNGEPVQPDDLHQ